MELGTVDEVVNNEIDEILKKGISKKRFEIEKKKFVFDSIFQRDGIINPAQSIGEAITIGLELDDVENINNIIEKISLESIIEALKNFRKTKNFVIGELKN